jgi:hypothetical protein
MIAVRSTSNPEPGTLIDEPTQARGRRASRRNTLLAGAMVPAAALLLASCGLDHGTVTGKDYEPSYVYFMPSCAGSDAKGNCTTWVQIPTSSPDAGGWTCKRETTPARPAWTG